MSERIINKYTHSVEGWVGNHLNKTVAFNFEVKSISYEFDSKLNKFIFIMPSEAFGEEERNGIWGSVTNEYDYQIIEDKELEDVEKYTYRKVLIKVFKESFYSKLKRKFEEELPVKFKYV